MTRNLSSESLTKTRRLRTYPWCRSEPDSGMPLRTNLRRYNFATTILQCKLSLDSDIGRFDLAQCRGGIQPSW